jgi:hypothetical protein
MAACPTVTEFLRMIAIDTPLDRVLSPGSSNGFEAGKGRLRILRQFRFVILGELPLPARKAGG